ncbi:unnamed protein product [Ostreobium quekettii]|uniref:Uncharacterized protein n=1 Tax=Ostreobium quekettii TaxID=121088 RepID=A0A8S1J7G6_9CHLO|nr:unnamed protein product [Ostreobium quekettii]
MLLAGNGDNSFHAVHAPRSRARGWLMLASETSWQVLLLLTSLSRSHFGGWHARRGAGLHVGCDDGLVSAVGRLLWCFSWKRPAGPQDGNEGGRDTLCEHRDPNHILGHFDVCFVDEFRCLHNSSSYLLVRRKFVLYGGHCSQWRRKGAPCIKRAPGCRACWHPGHALCTLQGRSGALELPCYSPVALGRCRTWRMGMGSFGGYIFVNLVRCDIGKLGIVCVLLCIPSSHYK